MKLSSFLLPALAGLAAANDVHEDSRPVECYLFRNHETPSSSSEALRIAGPEAHAVVLQRLGIDHDQQPEEFLTKSQASKSINYFGKTIQPLFQDVNEAKEPHQLVLVLKGASDKTLKSLRKLSSVQTSVNVHGLKYLPSAYLPQPLTNSRCKLSKAISPDEPECWNSGKVQYYEVEPEHHQSQVPKVVERIQALARDNAMETLLMVVPADVTLTPKSELNFLKRRDFGFKSEQVLNVDAAPSSSSEHIESNHPDTSPNQAHAFVARKGVIPASFLSRNACETTTGNCTGHGNCFNRYSADSKTASWYCRCHVTNETDHRVEGHWMLYHWGGNACQKIDVSTPFWLFVGFTVVLVGLVGGSIALLFSVGEEKLPGVIGAGVSRGK